jgi:hypothetical protein
MGLDSAEELSGYDEVDSDQVFNGGYLSNQGNSPASEGRRRGKKPLASRGTYRSKQRRPSGIVGIFPINLRHFDDAAKAMLAVSIGALALCAILLYATFGMHLLPDFYGALAASVVVMALLFYTASRLIGGNR